MSAAGDSLGAVGGVLGREVGGLPVVAWAGIAGAGILLGRRLLAGRASSGGGGTATPFVDPNTTGYTATGEPATSGGAGAVGKPTYADNIAWRKAALDYLSSVSVAGATAQRAIDKYLTGGDNTATDEAIVNTAIRAIGPPPESVPVGAPPATSPVPGTPRGIRSTTVLAPYGMGENLNQVAARIRRPKLLGGLGVTTTPDNRPLTAAYLAGANGLRVRTDVALRKGTRISF